MRSASGVSSARFGFDVCWIFVAIGVFLRIWQYSWNRSLFIDEAALALNLRTHSFAELIGRLDHAQFAPLGFLYLQKVLHDLIGESEYILRAPALAAGLLSLPLFLLLARRTLPASAAWLAVALFATSRALVFWSSDAKSYAFDVLATIMVLLLALRWFDRQSRSNTIALSIVGAVSAYFSMAVFLTLGGVGIGLILRGWWTRRGELATVFATWLLAVPALIHYRTSLAPADRDYFRADWWEGFLPVPFTDGASAAYTQQLTRTLYDPLGFGYPLPAFLAGAALLAGIVWLARARPLALALLAGPVLVTWIASMAGVYPIGQAWNHWGRVLLFLAPVAFLCIGAALGWIRRPVIGAGLGGAIFFVATIPAVYGLPYTRGEIRRALEYVERHAQSADTIYLYYGMALPIAYYQPELPGTVVQGQCSQEDRSEYIRDLERLRGNPRVWVVLASNIYNENLLILDFLEKNAVRLDDASFGLAHAALYDFRILGGEPPADILLDPPYRPYAGTFCAGVFAVTPPRDASS